MDIIVFIVSAAFVGSAHAACDNTTASKVQECVFKSDLLQPDKLPTDNDGIGSYCTANATLACMASMMGECNADERQMNLMKSMITAQRVMDHQMYLCDNKTAVLDGNLNCLQDFQSKEFQDCLSGAVGQKINHEPETELKKRLDDMCEFFDAYAKCFEGDAVTENCKMFAKDAFMMSVNGIRYAYCDMDAAGKESVVSAYTVGSSSVLAASIVTVFAAFLLSMFN